MAATISLSSSSTLVSVRCSTRASKTTSQRRGRVVGNLGHLAQVVRKDMEFLKKGISRGVEWMNETLHVQRVSKTLDDFLWLRYLEDPHAPPLHPRSWPQPSYPELSGVDLLLADLKALEAYAGYLYYLSKAWSKPLPEVYDPQDIADYFSRRPHIVAFRLLEVFFSFASAAVQIRTSGIRKFLRLSSYKVIDGDISQYHFGMVLKETMLNLGPAFIKVGQSLSTRPDIIGPEISKALSELHDQIPPFSRAVAMKIIEEELGSPVESFFRNISEEPVAAASFGQVYRGTTVDGFTVAVKVQRPDLLHLVVRDIYILRLALGLLHKIAKRKGDPRLYADELGKGLVGELDYTLEAANASEFQVNKGVEASLVQLLETGLLHADPHPGNLRYTPSGQIAFLDFGLLCRMEKKHQFAMLASIIHIVNGDWASLVHALTEMDVVRPGTDIWRVTMDLEYALGEVEFKDGIPDVKFSRVLGKIWSVALKYHFRMPPYYTLLLRSLASLEGLAVSGDKSFKTFEAAYPYVVQKLLTDNSAATRKILHSVVLNRKMEFRWQRLALFLRVGAARKGLTKLITSDGETSFGYVPNRASADFDVANLILRLLPSKDGVVLRRLLMTADGASLIRAMVCKEAKFFRQYLCRVIASILYQWMCETLGQGIKVTQSSSQVRLVGGLDNRELASSSRLSLPIRDYHSILRDRRLKVIFLKVLDSTRRDPVLLMRFCWASFVMFVTASALACHRFLVSLSETYLSPVSFAPKRYAVSS
ncbi:hypothetical protein I3760_02G173900 [Carya illinoinensis]|nr:hypothetical protein I3760_02G173900 [Carya illinoinensis]